MSREEIQAMFGVSDVKQTRFYQEAFEDGVQQERLKVVSQLLRVGFTAERIAEVLSLSLEEVRRIIENQVADSSGSN